MTWQFVGFMHPIGRATDRKNKYAYGPLPVKRWVKSPDDKRHKMNYKTPRATSRPRLWADEKKAAYRAQAIEYCRWLARRDGIALPDGTPIAFWSGDHISGVTFTHRHFESAYVTVNIPNFDWEPRKPVETIDRPGDGLVAWLNDFLMAA